MASLCPTADYKDSQEWFISRDVQDIRVVSTALWRDVCVWP